MQYMSQDMYAGSPGQQYSTPPRPSAFSQAAVNQMHALSNFSVPASALETAGKQDEVIRLKGAMNEKEMELIELREQHMQLVARSQEARSNWETALQSKDRAIQQLEEALASRQRALDAASRNALAGQEGVSQELAAAQARMKLLETNLAEAHDTVMSQSQTISDQARQLEAARLASTQEVSASDARTRALQQELASSKLQQDQLQREVKQQQALAAEKDARLADAAAQEQRLRQQADQLREQLQQSEASARQQPQHLQQQLSQLGAQLQAMQQRAAAKEASSKKYKDAVRAFKVKLQERDEALGQRQAQILELHTELSQLQRLLKMGPLGAAAAAGAGLRGSSSRGLGQLQDAGACWPCGSPGRCSSSRPHFSRGSAEDALAAATDELERLRTEVHGFHLELAALQAQLQEKDAHMQAALSDAAHLDAERHAAATRAEKATTAAFNLERQLREAQNAHQEAEQARKAAAEQLAAAEARLTGLQSDQARSIRAEGELRVQLQQLQEQLGSKGEEVEQLERQLQEVQQAKADASRRIQQLEARSEALEAKLDASACESGQAMRRAHRHETEVASLAADLQSLQQQLQAQQQEAQEEEAVLQEQLQQQRARAASEIASLQQQLEAAGREVRGSEAAAADKQMRAREAQLGCSRQVQQLELQVQEAVRQAQAADRERQQLEVALAAAEGKAAAADRRAGEVEGEMLLLGRSLRDAEAAVVEWQVRACQAEDAHQELRQVVASSEAAVKQVQADLAHMQLTHSSERAHATAQQQQLATQQQQLECSLSDAQAARADAEARVREAEAKLCDMRAALDSQERLLRVLREQVAEGGIAAARAGDLEAAVQALEFALQDARHTISQLRAAAASSDQEARDTVNSLLSELADKSSQLVDAERRFSELEAMMQRIASRTGQGQGLAADQGLSGLRHSVDSQFLDRRFDFQQQHQQNALRSSWGAQQYQQCGLGVDDGCGGVPSISVPYSPLRNAKMPC